MILRENELRKMPVASLKLLKKVLDKISKVDDTFTKLSGMVADAIHCKRELLENDLRRVRFNLENLEDDDEEIDLCEKSSDY